MDIEPSQYFYHGDIMANQITVQELIDYYVNLLIIQYHDLPKAQATIAALVNILIANGIFLDIQNAYDIDTAVGVQLDVIGKYAGVDRFYKGQDLQGFFSFIDYSQVNSPPITAIGFSDYSEYPSKPGKWLIYSQVLSSSLALDDEDFRTLIKLKIIENNSNFSHKEIDDEIFNAFGLDLIPDSMGNMTMNYFVNANAAAIIMVAAQKGLLPKPIAVGIRYIIPQYRPFFGFATYAGLSPLITGFTDYADYGIESGETLTYSDLVAG